MQTHVHECTRTYHACEHAQTHTHTEGPLGSLIEMADRVKWGGGGVIIIAMVCLHCCCTPQEKSLYSQGKASQGGREGAKGVNFKTELQQTRKLQVGAKLAAHSLQNTHTHTHTHTHIMHQGNTGALDALIYKMY